MRGRVCLDSQFVLQELPRLSIAEIRVLFTLHLHHSVERGCWPGVKTIAGLTGLHRGTVHAALLSLKDKELVDFPPESKQRCYRLPVDDRNVLRGGPDKWSDRSAVSSRGDSRQGEVSGSDVPVSCTDVPVSCTDVPVSGNGDSESRRETTVSRTPHAGARAHAPKEETHEETHEETPPAAAGGAQAQGKPEPPESNPPVPFTQNPGLSPAAKRLIAGIGLYPSSHTEPQDAPVHAQGAQ